MEKTFMADVEGSTKYIIRLKKKKAASCQGAWPYNSSTWEIERIIYVLLWGHQELLIVFTQGLGWEGHPIFLHIPFSDLNLCMNYVHR